MAFVARLTLRSGYFAFQRREGYNCAGANIYSKRPWTSGSSCLLHPTNCGVLTTTSQIRNQSWRPGGPQTTSSGIGRSRLWSDSRCRGGHRADEPVPAARRADANQLAAATTAKLATTVELSCSEPVGGKIVDRGGLQFGLQFTAVRARFSPVHASQLTCGVNACEPL